MIFSWIRQGVWKAVKYQGKIREKSGNYELDDKWQPCQSCSQVDTVNHVMDSLELHQNCLLLEMM